MSENAPTAEELKARIRALQERDRIYEASKMKFEDLTKDFARDYCEASKGILEYNLEIAEKNVVIFEAVRDKLLELLGEYVPKKATKPEEA